jgi:paired amphipathic helix protein Sin3a
LNFFHKIKQRLSNQQLYYEFLKCLNLFSQGIISRVELALLVKDLLSAKHKDLFDWFRNYLGLDEATFEMIERNVEERAAAAAAAGVGQFDQQMKAHSEIDFKMCKRYGPSYRALPKNVSLLESCSL